MFSFIRKSVFRPSYPSLCGKDGIRKYAVSGSQTISLSIVNHILSKRKEDSNESNDKTTSSPGCRCDYTDTTPMVQTLQKGTGTDGHDTRNEGATAPHREMDVRAILH